MEEGHEGGATLGGLSSYSVLTLPNENLIAAWPLRESGSPFIELISGLDGTGNTTQDDGLGCDYSQFFTGSEYITMPSDGWHGPFTITAWLKINQDFDGQRVLFNRGDSIVLGWDFMSELWCRFDGSTEVYGIRRLEANRWYHVAISWDQSEASFYVDGILDMTEDADVIPAAQGSSSYFGLWVGGGKPSANVQDVRLFGCALDRNYLKTERANTCTPGFYTAGPGESPELGP